MLQLINKYWRQFLIAATILITVNFVSAQTATPTLNYIEMRTPRTQIQTETDLDAKSPVNDSVMTTIQYIDGLGRLIQTVQYQASPTDKDIIQPVVYDEYGREVIKYMPYAITTSSTGSYKTDALTTGYGVAKFYNPTGVVPTGTPPQQTNGIAITAYPYAVTGYEPSPLNRVVEQGAPGENFQLLPGTGNSNNGNHTTKIVYSSNDLQNFVTTTLLNNAGDHQVALYTANLSATLGDQTRTLSRLNNNAHYGAGQLELTITKSENWKLGDGCLNTMEEYKDKEGHIVLKRTYDMASPTALEELSTYYVYDDLNNLCYVLPPGLTPDLSGVISQTKLDNLAYVYRYDEQNRLTQKKLPGKGWEFMVYNPLDQVVATQTANQRNQTPQQWTLTKYDNQGRVIITGLWNYNTSSTADNNLDTPVQTDFLALTAAYKSGTYPLWEAPNPNNPNTGYDELSYPTGHSYTFLTINYYDNYTSIPGLPANYTNTTYSTMTTGLATATKTYVLNTTDPLWTVTYYDNDGMPVRVFKQHYLGGTTALSQNNYDDITTTYNFNKQPISIIRTHYDNISNVKTQVLKLTDSITYDQMGRTINTYNQIKDHTHNPQAKTLISQNIYNEIGQLEIKKLQSRSPFNSYLQTVDYRYTPRGWLSSINNATLNMSDATTNSTGTQNDIFGEELYYDAPPGNSIPQYNGNIASVRWKCADPPNPDPNHPQLEQGYDYGYDQLNRLTAGVGVTSGMKDVINGTGMYDEYITYNTMGNITALGRYDGNTATPSIRTHLDSLTYTYSGNQPTRIDNSVTGQSGAAVFVDGVQQGSEYLYDIDGNMTRDRNKNISPMYNFLNLPNTINIGGVVGADVYIYDANGTKLRKINTVGSTITTTDYVDGIEYDNGSVAFIQTEEGRARWNPANSNYRYEYDLKDHLGDTRVTFYDDGTGKAQVAQLTNYYPFGATIGSLSPGLGYINNHYLYNHKELQDETNLYDYGARFYDPVIARWTTPDPLSEINRRYTPYNYVEDNPIRNIDPDGMACLGCRVKYRLFDERGGGSDEKIDWNPFEHDVPDEFKTSWQRVEKGSEDGKFADNANEGDNKNQVRSDQPTPKPSDAEVQKTFPGAKRVKGSNGRTTWRLPDGTYLQWDKQHGEYELFDKTGKIHLGVKNAKGQLTNKKAYGTGRSIHNIVAPLPAPPIAPIPQVSLPEVAPTPLRLDDFIFDFF